MDGGGLIYRSYLFFVRAGVALLFAKPSYRWKVSDKPAVICRRYSTSG